MYYQVVGVMYYVELSKKVSSNHPSSRKYNKKKYNKK